MGKNLQYRVISDVCIAESLNDRARSLVKSNWVKAMACYDEARGIEQKHHKDEWIAIYFKVLETKRNLKIESMESQWHIVRDSLV
jgi:hypothetical protein